MAQPLQRNGIWSDPRLQDAVNWVASSHPVRYDPQLPSAYPNILGQLISMVKMFVVRLVVQPLLDRVVVEINRRLTYLDAAVNAMLTLDRSVECYVYATKGETALNLPSGLVGERL
jgi:hypothetical protein